MNLIGSFPFLVVILLWYGLCLCIGVSILVLFLMFCWSTGFVCRPRGMLLKSVLINELGLDESRAFVGYVFRHNYDPLI